MNRHLSRGALLCSLLALSSLAYGQEPGRPYHRALGARVEWGQGSTWGGVSYKHFLTRRSAFEGQLLLGKDQVVPELGYVFQPGFRGVPGLYSLIGAGIAAPVSRGKADGLIRVTFGLEYQFAGLPLHIGIDWRPSYRFTGDDSGERFVFRRYGIPLRFTF